MRSYPPAIQLGTLRIDEPQKVHRQSEYAAWFDEIQAPAGAYPIFTRFDRAMSGTPITGRIQVAFTGPVVDFNDASHFGGVPIGGRSEGVLGTLRTIVESRSLEQIKALAASGHVTFSANVAIDPDGTLRYASEMARTGAISIKSKNLLTGRFAESAYLEEFFEKHEVKNLTKAAFYRGVVKHLVLPQLESAITVRDAYMHDEDYNPFEVLTIDGVRIDGHRGDVTLKPETLQVKEADMIVLLPTLQHERATTMAKANEGHRFSGPVTTDLSRRNDDIWQEVQPGSKIPHARVAFGANVPANGATVTISYENGKLSWRANERTASVKAEIAPKLAGSAGGMGR